MKRLPESKFSNALRSLRVARGFTQEDFDEVSSRVYISALERGIKQPTLRKVEALAGCLGVHPLALLVLSYCRKANGGDAMELCERAVTELGELLEKRQSPDGDPPPGAGRSVREVSRRRS